MSKFKYKIIIAAAALLLIGVGIYIYAAANSVYKPSTEQSLSVWYVNDDAMTEGFAAACEEYNTTLGEKSGITVEPVAFDSTDAMYDAVDAARGAGEGLPSLLVGSADYCAYLDSEGLLAQLETYSEVWDVSEFDENMLAECKSEDRLVCLPIASETNVFIVNTDLFSDTSSLSNFEQLCSVAGEYYSRSSDCFFTVSDYTLFFRDAIFQLGEEFDGVSPRDTDSDNCKYVYKLLAEAAYDRGFTNADTAAAKMLADGDVAAAIISSADVMKYAEELENGSFEFVEYPYLKDGRAAYTETVTGITIFTADEEGERSAAEFLRWFTDSDENGAFVGDSGYLAASGGESGESDYSLYNELMSAVSDIKEAGSRADRAASAEYFTNSGEFEEVMCTLMNTLN